MNFHSRTTYLACVQAWKAAYRAHSAEIRSLKHSFREAQRSQAVGQINALRAKVEAASQTATRMIAERHEGKREAQRQVLAERAGAAQQCA